jgi:branched-subunit amino acid ABC-type transport system permease component
LDEFLVLVMTGSVMGGLSNVAGAVVSGFLVVVSQKILLFTAIALFGISTLVYESLYPMMFVVIILLLQPEGIMGAFDKSRTPSRPLRARVTDSIAQITSRIRRLTR